MLTIDLSGRVALVVGGSRGIGAAITETLCSAGAETVFTHTGNPAYRESVEELIRDIREKGGRAEAAAVDARDPAATAALVNRITKEHGKLDTLVANPGHNAAMPATEISDSQWRDGLEVNLGSAFYAVRAALPGMLANRFGRIILIGSSAAYDGGGGAIDYATAKAGLDGMMRYLARNYTRRGVVTNVVHPCVIDTALLRERYSDEEKRKALTAQIPAGRLGQVQDIAGLVTYLVSSWGDYICGQSILVDGGRTLFR